MDQMGKTKMSTKALQSNFELDIWLLQRLLHPVFDNLTSNTQNVVFWDWGHSAQHLYLIWGCEVPPRHYSYLHLLLQKPMKSCWSWAVFVWNRIRNIPPSFRMLPSLRPWADLYFSHVKMLIVVWYCAPRTIILSLCPQMSLQPSFQVLSQQILDNIEIFV